MSDEKQLQLRSKGSGFDPMANCLLLVVVTVFVTQVVTVFVTEVVTVFATQGGVNRRITGQINHLQTERSKQRLQQSNMYEHAE